MDSNEVALFFPSDEYHFGRIYELMKATKINYGKFRFIPVRYIVTSQKYLLEWDIKYDTEGVYIILVIALADPVKHDVIKEWFENDELNVLGMSETIYYRDVEFGITIEYEYTDVLKKLKSDIQ